MKFQLLKASILLIFTLMIIYCLNRQWNSIPALGKFLDPFNGCWQNATDDHQQEIIFSMTELHHQVIVKFDERLVPHIFAQNDEDAIFVQGYLHAQFRLWQMDMTARLASGRLSEVIGKQTLNADREMRRKGMVYGAENSLLCMESDTITKKILDAYTKGVNKYIHSLRYKTLPLEYKLMSFEPEDWDNLKTALMLKFMSDKLSGHTEDFELTLAKQLFKNDFNLLFPERLDEEYPVIDDEKGSVTREKMSWNGKLNKPFYANHSLSYKKNNEVPTCTGQLQNHLSSSGASIEDNEEGYLPGIGSNNWAVSGTLTKSGKPILCNDPHLQLNLPSIWYENQIITPNMNVYGVSLPGAPQVVIGFNDSIAWGFTNGYRDVKDFYTIQFKDNTRKEYLFDGKYIPCSMKIETIKIKGQEDYKDTVAYTKMGIVMYDKSYPREGYKDLNFSVQWAAFNKSNELKALIGLNKGKQYADFVEAIQSFHCPHQNIVFACANGDIGMWSQGLFNQKKQEQGRFIQEGNKTENKWGDTIPEMMNPHSYNPAKGYVMSANQINTTKKYPFYYNGIFTEERAKRLTFLLSNENKFDIKEMMMMQNDNYWQNAADCLPIFLNELDTLNFNQTEKEIFQKLKNWNYYAYAENHEPVLYDLWFKQIEQDVYDDEFGQYKSLLNYPKERVTLQLLRSDKPIFIFDNTTTKAVETKHDIIQSSFLKICSSKESKNLSSWYQYKGTTLQHLSKLPAFSYKDIPIGGGHGIINAATNRSGPSWRMIVHFTNPIEAYGIFPGGESGNPGSYYYSNSIENWSKGNYFQLHFAKNPNDIR